MALWFDERMPRVGGNILSYSQSVWQAMFPEKVVCGAWGGKVRAGLPGCACAQRYGGMRAAIQSKAKLTTIQH